MAKVTVGQIVKGAVCGTFVVIGLRTIGGEAWADLKEVHPVTLERQPGKLALPVARLVEVGE